MSGTLWVSAVAIGHVFQLITYCDKGAIYSSPDCEEKDLLGIPDAEYDIFSFITILEVFPNLFVNPFQTFSEC